MTKYRTFNEWSSLGYKINKGAKSLARHPSGEALFSENQVTYSPRRTWNSTFKGCAPKGTAGWSIYEEEEEDDMSNPLTYDWLGRW